MDTPILKALTNQVFLRHNAQVHHIPLHRQFSPWAGEQRKRRAPVRQLDGTPWATIKTP